MVDWKVDERVRCVMGFERLRCGRRKGKVGGLMEGQVGFGKQLVVKAGW